MQPLASLAEGPVRLRVARARKQQIITKAIWYIKIEKLWARKTVADISVDRFILAQVTFLSAIGDM